MAEPPLTGSRGRAPGHHSSRVLHSFFLTVTERSCNGRCIRYLKKKLARSKGGARHNTNHSYNVMARRNERGVRAKRSRRWTFTLFGFRPNSVIRLRELGRGNDVRYLIFGREVCPTTGRRHLQGYVQFPNARSLDGVKSLLGRELRGIHLEAARGTGSENRKYCSKENDFEEFGRCPTQGARRDLDIIKARIDDGASPKDIATDHFSAWCQYRRSFAAYRTLLHQSKLRPELRCYYLHGSTGTGKTRFVYEYARKTGRPIFRVPDPGLRWFDGYENQEIVLFDDYRGDAPIAHLLQLLDIYPLDVPIKGSFVPWNPTCIFVTSNVDIEDLYEDPSSYQPLRRRFHGCAFLPDGTDYRWEDRYREIYDRLGIE